MKSISFVSTVLLSAVLSLCSLSSNAQTTEEALQEKPSKELYNIQTTGLPHRHTIGVNIGLGCITSRIYTPYASPETKLGFDWKLEYDYMFDFGLGVGFQYSGFNASFEQSKTNISMNYFAPTLVGKVKSRSWIFKFGVGAGCFLYDNSDTTSTTLGVNYELTAEYIISEKFGFGFGFHGISSTYPAWRSSANGYIAKKEGVSRVNLQVGGRYYF
ncbi:hypothetical protein LJC21_02190 [Bacteroides sp. OttesenSCG-928-E20]|nr:hypothetical protein [Bacteroides sp. OttesenSCG-928-N06]MDL2299500.1 hypothetical protein [Bacteroides sp. OttesenSCG-928-E20]MDL2304667.1 hypothetical protein [Bacteroides sp. OttesenSCG-928-D19]